MNDKFNPRENLCEETGTPLDIPTIVGESKNGFWSRIWVQCIICGGWLAFDRQTKGDLELENV